MTKIDCIGSDNLGGGVLAELAGDEFDSWTRDLPNQWFSFEPNLDSYEFQQLRYEGAGLSY